MKNLPESWGIKDFSKLNGDVSRRLFRSTRYSLPAALSSFFLLLPAPACAQIAPPASVVDWWTGDSNTVDIVGQHDGTFSPAAKYSPGQVGPTFDFDGSRSYVQTPALALGLTQGTIEFWSSLGTVLPHNV